MSIKDKKGAYEFKNSNLRFHGMKMDINGNPCFVLSTPNQRAFSVQQDPAYTIYWELGQSGESIVEKNYKDSDDFEKYIVDYIKKFGSKKQKSNLHVYNEDNRKIGFYTDNKGNKAVYTMSYDESDNECELTKVKDGKKTLVARTKIFSNGKITTSHKSGYDLENCDELHKDYFDFVEKHIKKDNNFACGKSNLVSLELPKEIEYKGKKVKITADGIRAFIVGNERFGYGEGRINYLGDPTNGLENAEKEAVDEIKRMIDYTFEEKKLFKSVIEKAKKNKKCYAICYTQTNEKRDSYWTGVGNKYNVVKEWTILNEKDPYLAITEYKNTRPERKVVFYPDFIIDKYGKLIEGDRGKYQERFDRIMNFSIINDIFSGGILMF